MKHREIVDSEMNKSKAKQHETPAELFEKRKFFLLTVDKSKSQLLRFLSVSFDNDNLKGSSHNRLQEELTETQFSSE